MRTKFLRLPDRLINVSEIQEIVEIEGPYPQNKRSRIIFLRRGGDLNYIDVDISLKELAFMLG